MRRHRILYASLFPRVAVLWAVAAMQPLGSLPASAASSDMDAVIAAFDDGIKHYRDSTGRTDYPRYDPSALAAIADNILLHQRDNGGWRSNWDPLRILTPEEQAAVAADSPKEDTTLDNRATYPQIEFLAHAYTQTGDLRYREGALRGVMFLFEAEIPGGGWPHSYPDLSGYRGHITFMDDVTIGVLRTLRKVASGAAPFGSFPNAVRDHAATAVMRGDMLILDLQIEIDGALAAWAGQYCRETRQPAQARSYELPSVVSAESVPIVQYLMDIEPPPPAIVRAVEGAAQWFERSKILGIRVESIAIEPIRYQHHTATTDRVVIKDPEARPIWARFYELDTNRPFMANRDGTKVYSLAEVDHERRTGYGWYTYRPAGLIERQVPRWRARWMAERPELFEAVP